MDTEKIGYAAIVELKDILHEIQEAQEDLEANLKQLHGSLEEARSRAQELERELREVKERRSKELEAARAREQDLNRRLEEAQAQVQELKGEIEEARRQRDEELAKADGEVRRLERKLREVTKERDEARYKYSSLQKGVENALERGLRDIYKIIGRESPFDEARTLKGLAGRYRSDKERLELELQQSQQECCRRIPLEELIGRVGPGRLAKLMDMVDSPNGESASEPDDLLKLAQHFVRYLKDLNVRVTHKRGERVSIRSEEELRYFDLGSERYRGGGTYQVVAPGLSRGEDIVVKAKVRCLESEERQMQLGKEQQDDIGEGCSGEDVVGSASSGGEVPGSAETPATGSGETPADHPEE